MKRLTTLVGFLLIAALALSGCSSTSATAEKAEGFTGTTELPSGTVGILNNLGSSETLTHWQNTATDALGKVGWTAVVADGKGDPAVYAQSLSSFVQQKVDGIIILGGFQTGPIAEPLRAAQDAGIPVLALGINSPDPDKLITAQYAPDDAEFGVVLGNYLKEKLPAGSEWVALTLTAQEGANAPNVAAVEVLEPAGFPRVGTVDLNISGDIPSQVSKGATDLLRAHPDAAALMTCCDFTATLSAPALAEAGYPDVINAVRYDNLSILDLIRAGKPVVTAGANTDTSILIGIDQLLAYKASGTAFDVNAQEGVAKFVVIDKDNVPAEGFYFDPQEQIETFLTKWKAEYK
ncbi:MAG TPA: substrate-binding domain-containing protein [Mycobacterium sp.]|nr:substrate-binding domain-containing protein [Mycobacterium sp.]